MWPVHTAQLWFDLLLAVATGWTLVLPRVRAAGMRAVPWLALICQTGSIGFLAMLARLICLEEQGRGRA